jgi:uncharacterized protein
MDEQLTETLRRIYAAVQHGDTEELQGRLAHDIEWVLPESVPWGGTHHGHLGVEASREIFGDHVDGAWADPDEILDAGDSVVVLGRISGRGHATGRSFEVEFVHVWGITDGVPSRLRAYFDTARILSAIGADPA